MGFTEIFTDFCAAFSTPEIRADAPAAEEEDKDDAGEENKDESEEGGEDAGGDEEGGEEGGDEGGDGEEEEAEEEEEEEEPEDPKPKLEAGMFALSAPIVPLRKGGGRSSGLWGSFQSEEEARQANYD